MRTYLNSLELADASDDTALTAMICFNVNTVSKLLQNCYKYASGCFRWSGPHLFTSRGKRPTKSFTPPWQHDHSISRLNRKGWKGPEMSTPLSSLNSQNDHGPPKKLQLCSILHGFAKCKQKIRTGWERDWEKCKHWKTQKHAKPIHQDCVQPSRPRHVRMQAPCKNSLSNIRRISPGCDSPAVVRI